jgi:predicted naringenin-chalcone synthase
MGIPRILAVGTAVPAASFTQDEVADMFGYDDPVRRSFFVRSGIERRHFFVGAGPVRPTEDIDQLAARFEVGSVALAVEAVRRCLDRGNTAVSEVDFLVTTTCTGRLVPSLDAHLMRALGMRVQRVHVGDTGCASAVVALQQAFNYLRTFPGRRALVVAAELCSTTYTVDGSLETAVANAIFADGAAALLLGTDGEGISLVGHGTLVRSEYLDRMGFTFPRGQTRIRLSKDVRRIAPLMMEELAARLLKDHNLRKEEVQFWVLHSAGRRVLERGLRWLWDWPRATWRSREPS